jgi:hypothetical protein
VLGIMKAGTIAHCSVDELVKALGMGGISKSQVSRLGAEIDERVRTFLERPIEGLPGRVGERGLNPAPTGQWPYLWIDATYVKVREAGRIVSVAVTIAVAVNTDGRREVLALVMPRLSWMFQTASISPGQWNAVEALFLYKECIDFRGLCLGDCSRHGSRHPGIRDAIGP